MSTQSSTELQQGKIFFMSFGSQTQLLVRFKGDDGVRYTFYDHLHYWNGCEKFHYNSQVNYCVKHGIEEIREATLPEKHALIRFELEHNCI